MLRIQARFPLGVYNAVSVFTPPDAEWPPSPLRLAGALLAAAHGRPGNDLEADRELIQQLCEAPPPLIVAPRAARVGEPAEPDAVFMLRGATRWVPRNYRKSNEALSPRNLGRERSEVSKAGVAVGEETLSFVWPDLTLPDDQLDRLRSLAADVSFIGTSRSLAIVSVDAGGGDSADLEAWRPVGGADESMEGVAVRVADAATIASFDRRERWRSSAKDGLEGAGIAPTIPVGQTIMYVPPGATTSSALDPNWWGDVIVLAVDTESSELIPTASASYLFARAVRVALLGAFGEPGTATEAPPALRGRGADPHCAIVPLPMATGPHPDWRIKGVAFVLPSPERAPQIVEERERIVQGIAQLAGAGEHGERRFVQIPGAGKVWLCEPDRRQVKLHTLQSRLYAGPARAWRTVTPLVHSHWRKDSRGGLMGQVETDCHHVNLPTPEEVEVVRGGHRMLPSQQIPKDWRSLLSGPSSHLRITFPEPVRGPVLLGRARHFGLGLCIPDDSPPNTRPQQAQKPDAADDREPTAGDDAGGETAR